MTASGRKRTFILLILTTIERPLLGKADIPDAKPIPAGHDTIFPAA
jgi:hypothetical protein